jgi:uncharacterized protein
MLIYESAVLTLVAYLVLRGFSPWLRSRRVKRVWLALALTVYVSWSLLHYWHAPLRSFVTILVGTWVPACLICIMAGLPLLATVLVQRLRHKVDSDSEPRREPIDEGRRQMLVGLTLPVIALSTGGAAALGCTSEFIVVRLELRIRNWPKALDGLRIGQITDTHVGDFVTSDTVARAVDVLDGLGVHLQVMTGDLVDDLTYLEATFAALERCRAPYGMLALLGNHEKMHHRLQPMLSAYAARRDRGLIRLLVDECHVIEHNGASLRVVGVDFPMHENGRHLGYRERYALMRQSAQRAFADVPTGEPLLCLSHHPEFFPLAAARRASLTLSGHTHGGQIAFAGRPLFCPYDYMLGHYRLANSQLYVSGGTGHWFPIRHGVPTEVTAFTLRSA